MILPFFILWGVDQVYMMLLVMSEGCYGASDCVPSRCPHGPYIGDHAARK
jgi:hypothetical protein